MDSNLKLILQEFEELKGQFVINHNVVERFIGIGSDDDDYYYITYNGRETKWNTCVGGIVPLKGKIDDKHYNEFIRLAKINHFDQPNLWIPRTDEDKQKMLESSILHKNEISKVNGTDKYLTDIYWDLN
jgi:hypothetical protein